MNTQMKNPELWNKLLEFQIDDPGSSFTLTQRLARENGWSIEYATRVIVEYKKFLYLAMTSKISVTPSDEVDQAWHLHMLYTESYWDELCGKVLGREIGHGPTKGGSSERVKYNDQYNSTLAFKILRPLLSISLTVVIGYYCYKNWSIYTALIWIAFILFSGEIRDRRLKKENQNNNVD